MLTGTENNNLSIIRHFTILHDLIVYSLLDGFGFTVLLLYSHVASGLANPMTPVWESGVVSVGHRAVGLTICSEWWQTTLLFVVWCCLCSTKGQCLCIPTISGRFVSSSLHIYPHVATVLPLLHQQHCAFNCYSRLTCIWLGFVSTEAILFN